MRCCYHLQHFPSRRQCLMLQALRGSVNLSKVIMSPAAACPKLAHVDLYGCPKLTNVLIQSQSLSTLKLSNCSQLVKVKDQQGQADLFKVFVLSGKCMPYSFWTCRQSPYCACRAGNVRVQGCTT